MPRFFSLDPSRIAGWMGWLAFYPAWIGGIGGLVEGEWGVGFVGEEEPETLVGLIIMAWQLT